MQNLSKHLPDACKMTSALSLSSKPAKFIITVHTCYNMVQRIGREMLHMKYYDCN